MAASPILLMFLAALPLAAQTATLNIRTAPYSAKGDGATDDTATIQRALDDAAARGGGIVSVPPGTYLVAGRLRIPPGVALQGVGRAPMSWDAKVEQSRLLAMDGAGQPDGPPFLTIQGPNATLEGITIFYPKQAIAETPVAYPWTIRGDGVNVSVVNVNLVNPYQAVDFATSQCPRHYVRGLYGQPLNKGIQVDQCYDIGRIKEVHFWPFWTQDKRIINYTTTHGTTFLFQRTDWEIVEDIFCWGYRVGVEFSASKFGGMNGQMTDINFDNVDIGIDAVQTLPYAVHISNLNIANDGAGTEHIGIRGRANAKGADISIRGASFWGRIHQVVRWENPGTLSLGDSRIVQWTDRQPALEFLAGTALIHDNVFSRYAKRAMPVLRVGPEVGLIDFHDNLLNGGTIANEAGAKARLSTNAP
jgi:hypothetical protein